MSTLSHRTLCVLLAIGLIQCAINAWYFAQDFTAVGAYFALDFSITAGVGE